MAGVSGKPDDFGDIVCPADLQAAEGITEDLDLNDEDGPKEVDSAQVGEDASVSEQLLGGNAGLGADVQVALDAHFMEIGQIRSVLAALEATSRDKYKIFSCLPAVTSFYILDLIKDVGGKNFGDMMLEVFYGEREAEMAAVAEESGFSEISTNRAFYVDTEVSRKMEEISFDLVQDLGEIIAKRFGDSPVSYFNPDVSLFRQYLMERVVNFPQILGLVDGVYEKLVAWDPNFSKGKYRLRGSMVFEDWLDTQVAGVSPSGSYNGTRSKEEVDQAFLRNCDNPFAKERLAGGNPDLWKFRLNFLLPYVEFLFHKEMSKLAERKDELSGEEKRIAGYARYHLEPEEQLGIQVAPELEVEKHVVAVIDEENVVSMDLNMKSLGDKDLLIRVAVDDADHISVHYGFDPEEYGHPERGHEDGEDVLERPAYLSKKQILGIAKIMRSKKSFYGFNLDGEFCLEKGGRLVDVQTRIAPDAVKMESADQELNLGGHTKVAESCFGLGQKFEVKGKLMFLRAPLTGLFSHELDSLVKEFGDLSQYILLLDQPLAASLFGLQRLAFEKGNVFAGVIDMSRGVALTHTQVQGGASNFLRTTIPVMGMGDNTKALEDLIKLSGGKFSTSEEENGEIIMRSTDGKTVQVYARKDVAKVLMPSFREKVGV